MTGALYDPNLAKELVFYSAASYCTAGLKNWTCSLCSPPGSNTPPLEHVNVIWNASSQVQGLVGYDKGLGIVVAFRGSVGALDWWEDFDFTLVDFPGCTGCQVSHGFFVDTFLSVWPQVAGAIENITASVGTDALPVHVTGHSLGAAIAELIAFYLSGNNNVTVITYGKPRVGK